MDRAVERVLKALDSGQKIAIWGDYDVDGTCSAAMLFLFLKERGGDVEVYIPDRLAEGYGVSTLGIDRLAANGVRLIITIDCGITAVEQVRYAQSLDIDVVICDHHEAGDEIPTAYAVLDPIKPGCSYPFKYLSGCGVGFKLMQGVVNTAGDVDSIFKYLDFVAMAAAADIVPLVDENRVLVSHGLRRLNDAPRPGLRGLLECAGMNSGSIGTAQIVFGIAPRINAAGRLGDARRAVEMLVEDDEVRAFQKAQVLESANRSRRTIDEETFIEAEVMAQQMLADTSCRVLVIHNPDWHPGVIGIVASRIVERFYVPTVMLTSIDGVAKGSARSVAGFDIHAALKQCEEHIAQFGGHKYAAGLSIEEGKIDVFRVALNEFASSHIDEAMRTPEVQIDAEAQLSELTPQFFNVVRQFAPFGPGNSRPNFLTREVEVIGFPKVVGKAHLKFRVRNGDGFIDAIAFGMGERLSDVGGGSRIDIVYNIEENHYRGTVQPQLRIIDFKRSGATERPHVPSNGAAMAAGNKTAQPPVS